MGNSNKRLEEYRIARSYRKQEWVRYDRLQNRQFWKNTFNQRVAEVFRLSEVPSSQDLDRYEWRNSQNDLVRVYHIVVDPQSGLCSKNQFVQLLVEYIPIRLSQVNNLSQEEALTILATTFRAFELMEANFETVQPNEELICFNEEGRPKIWINKDLSCNYPEKGYVLPYSNNKYQASSRVAKIVDMIERRTSNGLLPPLLKEQIRQNNPNFREALLILQRYAYDYRRSLKAYLKSSALTGLLNISFQEEVKKGFYERQAQQYRDNEHLTNNEGKAEGRQLRKQWSMGNFHSNSEWAPVLQVRESQKASRDVFKSQKGSLVGTSPNYQSVPKITFLNNNTVQYLTDLPANNKSYIAPDYAHPFQQNFVGDQPQRTLIRKVVRQSNSNVQPHLIIGHPAQQTLMNQIVNANSNLMQSASQAIQQRSCSHQKNKLSSSPQNHSIIDHLEGEVSKSPHSEQKNAGFAKNAEEQQFQVSGAFTPLADRQKFVTQGKDNQNSIESKLIEDSPSSGQLLINFQSFAPNQVNRKQLVSFVPVQTNVQTQQSIEQGENLPRTIESMQIKEAEKTIAHSSKPQEEKTIVIPNQQNSEMDVGKKEEMISEQSMGHRVSIDDHILRRQNEQNGFYVGYTPVQSKFDVIVKRDSVLSSDSNQRQKVSAFAILQEEQIEKYIRDKYANFINSDQEEYRGIRMSRVFSEYEKGEGQLESNQKISQQKIAVREKNRAVESQISKFKPKVDNIAENNEQDFLDVNYLQRSLQKKYRESANRQRCQDQREEDREIDVAQLEQSLLRFSNKKKGQGDGLKKRQINAPKEKVQNKKLSQYRTLQQRNRIKNQPKLTEAKAANLRQQPETLVSIQLQSNNQVESIQQKVPQLSRFNYESNDSNQYSKVEKEGFQKIERKYQQYVKMSRKEKTFNRPESGRKQAGYEFKAERGLGNKKISYDDLRSLLWK